MRVNEVITALNEQADLGKQFQLAADIVSQLPKDETSMFSNVLKAASGTVLTSSDDDSEDDEVVEKKISNTEKLEVYGLYKQATKGDNNEAQPWAYQLEKRSKWESWSAQKGKSTEASKKEYVLKVGKLLDEYQSSLSAVDFKLDHTVALTFKAAHK